MQFITLGRSSLKVSRLGIGALHFGVYLSKEEALHIVERAFDRGVNFIDTAPMYGRGMSESFIKHAVRGRRDKYVLATKVGLRPCTTPDGYFGVETVPLTARTIRDSLEASLKALGTDHVDLFQLHAFDETTPLDETFSALDSVVREGKVRFIGCSNYEGWQLERVADLCSRNKLPSFVTAQAHFNLIERRAAREVLSVCARQGVSGLINRPLARGILTGKYKWDQPLPPASRAAESLRVRKWLEEGTLRLVADLEDWAKGRGRTMPQLALAWLFAQKDVGAALVGVRNSDQLDDCLKAADWDLGADLKEVDGLIEKHGLTAQVHERPPALFEK